MQIQNLKYRCNLNNKKYKNFNSETSDWREVVLQIV